MADRTLELVKLAQAGDLKARDTIVEENIGLVWSVVRKIGSRGYEEEDIFQIGSIGLIKAIDKFDMSFEVRFSTYAVPMIMGEIKRFLRDDGMIKVSRSLKELVGKANMTKQMFMNGHKREPTLQELSQILEVEAEELAIAYEANAGVESIYAPVFQNDAGTACLLDRLEDSNNENEKTIERLTLNQIIDELEPQEREIIILRYYKEKTQTEIAKTIGISQVQVSRLEKKILARLRGKLIG